MDEGCFFQPFFQSKMGVFDIAGKKVFSVKNANDFAIVVLKYRNPGEAVVGKNLQGLLVSLGNVHGHHIHPGGHDFPDPNITEFNGGFDQLAILLVDGAAAGYFIYHQKQFSFGSTVGRFLDSR